MRRVFDHQFAAVKTLAHVYYIPNQTTLLQLNFAITTPLSLSSVSLASRATALGVSARPRRNLPAAGGRASASLKPCVCSLTLEHMIVHSIAIEESGLYNWMLALNYIRTTVYLAWFPLTFLNFTCLQESVCVCMCM